MKKVLLTLLALLLSQIALAKTAPIGMLGTYDFVAPSAYQTSDISDKALGGIIFQTSDLTFQGYTGDGNWVQLSVRSGKPVAASGSNQNINATYVTNDGSSTCTVTQEGSWIGSASHPAPSNEYQLNFASSYTSTPYCVCTVVNSGGTDLCSIISVSNSSISLATGIGTATTSSYNVMCMGN